MMWDQGTPGDIGRHQGMFHRTLGGHQGDTAEHSVMPWDTMGAYGDTVGTWGDSGDMRGHEGVCGDVMGCMGT